MTSLTLLCELAFQIVQKNLEEKQLEEEQAAKDQNWKLPVCYGDDDDEESSNSLEDNIISELPSYSAVTPTKPIDSLRIDETECHPEKEIRFAKRLLYDNSSPRPPEEIVYDNSDADIESFSPSPIPVEDSDSYMEEIDLPFNPDDLMPPGIEDDDYDSRRDILILEELLNNYSLSLPATFQPSAECPMIINGKNIPLLDVPLFHFHPLDQLKYGGI
nr:hypothetical protein [Tanacetum cinerariifolium]